MIASEVKEKDEPALKSLKQIEFSRKEDSENM
jgi:hypothetical protein